jgi:hypothetical protein
MHVKRESSFLWLSHIRYAKRTEFMTEKVETESVLEKRRVHAIISAKNELDGEREASK